MRGPRQSVNMGLPAWPRELAALDGNARSTLSASVSQCRAYNFDASMEAVDARARANTSTMLPGLPWLAHLAGASHVQRPSLLSACSVRGIDAAGPRPNHHILAPAMFLCIAASASRVQLRWHGMLLPRLQHFSRRGQDPVRASMPPRNARCQCPHCRMPAFAVFPRLHLPP